MQCPRCETEMKVQTIKDLSTSIQVDYCPSCGGTWFDKGELDQIEQIIEVSIIEIRNIPNKKNQLKKMKCPSCNLHPVMSKSEHFRDNKVIIDHCDVCHGIWLDKGELEAIQKDNLIASVGKIFKLLIGVK